MNKIIKSDQQLHTQQREKFLGQLVEATAGFFKIYSIYLGHRLGLYRGLVAGQALSSSELAVRTGTNERYVREWLEQQAVTGILAVEDETAAPRERRFRLLPGHAEVLLDRESINYLAPLAQAIIGVARPLGAIETAFRTGGGVPYAAYGEGLRHAVSELNRPLFLNQLGKEYLPSIPDIHRRLSADPPARVADIGCGTGWSSIGMALSYPKIYVDGFDRDEPSIVEASDNTHKAGLNGRVRFETRDAGDPALEGQYDLVTAFECIHDVSDPVAALSTMRRLAGPRGSVLVMDERSNEEFTVTENPVEQLLYGFSVMGCLPASMSDKPSAATGTVMRPSTLRRYARQAGFRDIEVLPIENGFFRFYRLITDTDGG